MAIQRGWEESQHELFYHRRDDEAYMRHHFREEVERNLLQGAIKALQEAQGYVALCPAVRRAKDVFQDAIQNTLQDALERIGQMLTSPSLLQTLIGHTGWVNSVAFSPDGQILASGSYKTIKLWLVSMPTRKWKGRAPLSEAEIDQLLQDLEQWQAEMKQQLREVEERRRMEALRAQRWAQGLCEDCGQPLSFWDKLLGRTKCPKCR